MMSVYPLGLLPSLADRYIKNIAAIFINTDAITYSKLNFT